MPSLRIALLSPLAAGSGFGRPGSVDREVPYDTSTGLPYLPGKTLKGLLRDSFAQISGAGAFPLPSVDFVFGPPGQEQGAPWRVGDAYPVGASDRTFWRSLIEKTLLQANKKLLPPQEVLREFTEKRRQTRISRRSGAPLKDTLRSFRVLRGSPQTPAVFEASIHGGTEAHWLALGLAASLLRSMGTSRNRGFGEVRCEIVEGDRNFTTGAIECLEKGTFPHEDAFKSTPKMFEPVEDKDWATLRFQLTLRADALLPASLQVNPNAAVSVETIPASVIRGLLAERFLQEYGHGEVFERFFLELPPKLIVRDAFPTQNYDGDLFACLPIPHSIRREKDSTHHVDLVRSDDKPAESLSREAGFVATEQVGNHPPTQHTRIHTHYHHRRAADPRAQRAVGSGSEELRPFGLRPGEGGAMFAYQSIAAHQTFQGQIEGEAGIRGVLEKLTAEPLQIGRSRNSQYGGDAVWGWVEAPEELPSESEEDTETAGSGAVIIDVLSPLVGVTSAGHPAAVFPVRELGPHAKIARAFTRQTQVSGFLSHQGLPRQQTPALEAGSTFEIEGFDPKNLDWVLRHGCGLRTEEGFGQIRKRPEQFLHLPENREWFSSEQPDMAPAPLTPDADTLVLLTRIWKGRLLDWIQLRAYSRNPPQRFGTIAPALVHRLAEEVALADGVARLAKLLASGLRDKPRKQVESVRFPSGKNLIELLNSELSAPQAALERLLIACFESDNSTWKDQTGVSPIAHLIESLGPGGTGEIMRTYLHEYLTQLARAVKEHRAKQGEDGGRK